MGEKSTRGMRHDDQIHPAHAKNLCWNRDKQRNNWRGMGSSERKQIEESWRESEGPYRAVVDAITKGVVTYHHNSTIAACNDSAACPTPTATSIHFAILSV